MRTRIKKYPGVYTYTSTKRRYQGKPDVCYSVRIKIPGSPEWYKIGWRSEGTTAAKAHETRKDLIEEIRTGKKPTPKIQRDITLGQAFDLWFEKHAKVNTALPDKAESLFNSQIREHLADKTLDEISALELEGYKGTLMREGYAAQSIKHALSLIRRIYRKMIAWDMYKGDIPTTKIEMPKVANSRDRWLTPREANMVLDEQCARSTQMHHMALFSLHSGMRWGEVAALTGESINFTAGTIRLINTKTNMDRTVFITPHIERILQAMHLRAGVLLFPNRNGNIMDAPSDSFTRAVEDLGLNDGVTDRRHRVVFHTLRHTFGSWLAMRGVPLYWIAKLMGHTRSRTTERYAHLCPDMQRQAVLCVDHLFRFPTEFIAGHEFSPDVLSEKPREPLGNNTSDDRT